MVTALPVYSLVSLLPVNVTGRWVMDSVPVAVLVMFENCAVTSTLSLKTWKLVTALTALSSGPGTTFVSMPSAAAVQVKPSGTPVTVKSSYPVFVSGVPSYTFSPLPGVTVMAVVFGVIVSVAVLVAVV